MKLIGQHINSNEHQMNNKHCYVPQPKLLILHERDEDLYFHITTDDMLFEIALKILKKRFENKYYEAPEAPADPEIDQNDLHLIKNPSLLLSASKILKNYNFMLKSYASEKQKYDAIVNAITTNNGKTAWDILLHRSIYEYERVELNSYNTENNI